VIVSKAGTITWPPLEVDVARARWSALLRAWRAGATRPLPLAVASAFAWLEQRATDTADEAAASAARACYEGADGELGAPGERDRNAYLARAFPDFDTLAASGEFAQLAETLLRPPMDALGKPAKAAKPAAGEST
jgi:exodeoxyribonuclease V gamma subunit